MKTFKNFLAIVAIALISLTSFWATDIFAGSWNYPFSISSNRWWDITLYLKPWENITFHAVMKNWTLDDINDYEIIWQNNENLQKTSENRSNNEIITKFVTVNNSYNVNNSKIAVYNKNWVLSSLIITVIVWEKASYDTLWQCINMSNLRNYIYADKIALSKCKRNFYYNDNEAWNYKVNSYPSKERCVKIKKWFLDSSLGWSSRFWAVTEPKICKEKYYDVNWQQWGIKLNLSYLLANKDVKPWEKDIVALDFEIKNPKWASTNLEWFTLSNIHSTGLNKETISSIKLWRKIWVNETLIKELWPYRPDSRSVSFDGLHGLDIDRDFWSRFIITVSINKNSGNQAVNLKISNLKFTNYQNRAYDINIEPSYLVSNRKITVNANNYSYGKPNLELSNFRSFPKNPNINDNIEISYDIKNTWNIKTKVIVSTIWQDFYSLDQSGLKNSLNPWESTIVKLTIVKLITDNWDLSISNRDHWFIHINFKVDADNYIDESNEDDNEIKERIYITPNEPDLTVDGFLFYPEFQNWTKNLLRIIVHNNWKEISNPEMSVTINWNGFKKTIIHQMKNRKVWWKSWSTEEFIKLREFWINKAWNYKITYVIDPKNKIIETKESNNIHFNSFYFHVDNSKTTDTCTDSDRFDYHNKWYVKHNWWGKMFDTCSIWYKKYVNDCSGDNCSVDELFCNNENIPSLKSYSCKYWCYDWRCLETEEEEADVPPPAWYEDDVIISKNKSNFKDIWIDTLQWESANFLYNKWVIWWYSDGTFKWNNLVNRAEAAKFLILAKFGQNFNSNENYRTNLWDVKQDEWYAPYVNKSESLGIIKWYNDWRFRPEQWVNRWELLKMLTRTFNLEENLSYDFTDVSQGWIKQYAWIVAKYDLFPNIWDKLNPWDYLTRNEVSIAIYQLIK